MELLAVIVILAIILAIAIPAITGLIRNTTINALESDAKMVLKAIEYKMLEVDGYDPTTIDETNIFSELNISAENYESLTVTMVNGKPHIEIVGKNKWSGLTASGIFPTITVVDNEEYEGPPVFACGDTLIDSRDDNEYATVEIGEQCWMQEDLRFNCALEGYVNISSASSWSGTNNCGNQGIGYIGMLYQWPVAMDGENEEGSKGLCPEGWYIPTDDDFKQLEMHLGMTQGQADGTGYRGGDQGIQLKDNLTWNGTNSSEFTALPAGYRYGHGALDNVNSRNAWWTSSIGTSNYWIRMLSSDSSSVYRVEFSNTHGLSIRCIMNQ